MRLPSIIEPATLSPALPPLTMVARDGCVNDVAPLAVRHDTQESPMTKVALNLLIVAS